MNGKALFATVRDGQPGLRELPGGPPTVAQPSRVDDLRAARFDAYRARIAAANRDPAAAARAGEADPAAAEIARRGRAAVGEALRHRRTIVLQA
jgi:hypothetical protein